MQDFVKRLFDLILKASQVHKKKHYFFFFASATLEFIWELDALEFIWKLGKLVVFFWHVLEQKHTLPLVLWKVSEIILLSPFSTNIEFVFFFLESNIEFSTFMGSWSFANVKINIFHPISKWSFKLQQDKVTF